MYKRDLILCAPNEICFMLRVFPTVLLATCFSWSLGAYVFLVMPGIGSILRLIDGAHKRNVLGFWKLYCFLGLDLIIAGKIRHFRNNSIWEAGAWTKRLGRLKREAIYICPSGFSNLRKPRLVIYHGAHLAVLIVVPLDCTDIHAFSR